MSILKRLICWWRGQHSCRLDRICTTDPGTDSWVTQMFSVPVCRVCGKVYHDKAKLVCEGTFIEIKFGMEKGE